MRTTHNSSIVIRDARSGDAAQITALGSRVFDLTFGFSVEPHQMQAYLSEFYSLEAITADIESPSKDMIVATDGHDGAVVGFTLLTRGTSEPCVEHLRNAAELQRIYVDPECQGRGVASLLRTSLEQRARKLGIEYLWLGVWEENYKAQKVYGSWGYERVGEHDFRMGDVVQTDNIMLKKL